MAARERLDLNLSTTLAELATTSINIWGRERDLVLEKDRGSYAPYRIRNRTGSPLFVWSDNDTSSGMMQESNTVKLNHDQIIDWRFDDWKKMREVSPTADFFNHVLTIFSTAQRPNNITSAFKWSENLGKLFEVSRSTRRESLPSRCGLGRRNMLIVCCALSLWKTMSK